MLYPPGRSSKGLDWEVLGFMVRQVECDTGYPEERDPPEPLTPLEVTHPNRAHHWAWNSDGSPLDPEFEKALRAFLTPPAGSA